MRFHIGASPSWKCGMCQSLILIEVGVMYVYINYYIVDQNRDINRLTSIHNIVTPYS